MFGMAIDTGDCFLHREKTLRTFSTPSAHTHPPTYGSYSEKAKLCSLCAEEIRVCTSVCVCVSTRRRNVCSFIRGKNTDYLHMRFDYWLSTVEPVVMKPMGRKLEERSPLFPKIQQGPDFTNKSHLPCQSMLPGIGVSAVMFLSISPRELRSLCVFIYLENAHSCLPGKLHKQ